MFQTQGTPKPPTPTKTTPTPSCLRAAQMVFLTYSWPQQRAVTYCHFQWILLPLKQSSPSLQTVVPTDELRGHTEVWSSQTRGDLSGNLLFQSLILSKSLVLWMPSGPVFTLGTSVSTASESEQHHFTRLKRTCVYVAAESQHTDDFTGWSQERSEPQQLCRTSHDHRSYHSSYHVIDHIIHYRSYHIEIASPVIRATWVPESAAALLPGPEPGLGPGRGPGRGPGLWPGLWPGLGLGPGPGPRLGWDQD